MDYYIANTEDIFINKILNSEITDKKLGENDLCADLAGSIVTIFQQSQLGDL